MYICNSNLANITFARERSQQIAKNKKAIRREKKAKAEKEFRKAKKEEKAKLDKIYKHEYAEII